MNAAAQADVWLASDESIGPGNTDVPFLDFTLVFENSVLSILPAAFLLVIFPLHVWRYSRPAKVASAGRLYWARLVRQFVEQPKRKLLLILLKDYGVGHGYP